MFLMVLDVLRYKVLGTNLDLISESDQFKETITTKTRSQYIQHQK